MAIVALAGGAPGRLPPEMRLEGEIAVRRRAPRPEPTPEPEPEPEEEGGAEPQPEPAQPDPERDPRLWSKPLGWSSPPPGSLRPTPWPSVTWPISVSLEPASSTA